MANLKKEIEALEKQLNQLKEKIKQTNDEEYWRKFKKNDWITFHHDNRHLYKATGEDVIGGSLPVKNVNGLSNNVNLDYGKLVLATIPQIKKALLDHYTKLGWKVGSSFEYNGEIHIVEEFTLSLDSLDSKIVKVSHDEHGTHLTINYMNDNFGIPIEKGILIKTPDLTFGGKKVVITRTGGVICEWETGTLSEIKNIINICEGNIPFGNVKLKQINSIVFDDSPIKSPDEKIRIGCLTGTLEELKNIVKSYEIKPH